MPLGGRAACGGTQLSGTSTDILSDISSMFAAIESEAALDDSLEIDDRPAGGIRIVAGHPHKSPNLPQLIARDRGHPRPTPGSTWCERRASISRGGRRWGGTSPGEGRGMIGVWG